MSRTRRTGILGGTFDPIHCGHLEAAAAARTALTLDEVLLVPTHVPPHRPVQPRVSSYHRFAMVGIAALGREALLACDLELRSPGPSYTSSTLARLAEAGFTPSELFFITGADAFADIATWKDYPSILDRCHFVVISRPGHPVAALRDRLPQLADRMVLVSNGSGRTGARAPARAYPLGTILLVEAQTADVSSSEIRRRLVLGQPVDHLLPDGVAAYIQRHRLYSSELSADQLHEQDRRQA